MAPKGGVRGHAGERSANQGRRPQKNAGGSKNQKSTDYTSRGVTDNDLLKLPSSDFQLLAVLIFIAALVRLFRLHQPSSVVFDEVHFGGFASKYIKGKFFVDVHPPLAKLLLTLAGWLAGFDGEFDFKDIGKDYLEPGVPFVAMRLVPAVMGVITVPIMFLTLKASGCRTTTAVMGAGLVIFGKQLDHCVDIQSSSDPLRKWSHYPIPPYSAGLSIDCIYCFHRFGVDMLHEPARTRPIKGL